MLFPSDGFVTKSYKKNKRIFQNVFKDQIEYLTKILVSLAKELVKIQDRNKKKINRIRNVILANEFSA